MAHFALPSIGPVSSWSSRCRQAACADMESIWFQIAPRKIPGNYIEKNPAISKQKVRMRLCQPKRRLHLQTAAPYRSNHASGRFVHPDVSLLQCCPAASAMPESSTRIFLCRKKDISADSACGIAKHAAISDQISSALAAAESISSLIASPASDARHFPAMERRWDQKTATSEAARSVNQKRMPLMS